MRKYEGIWKKRDFLSCWILQFICAGILGIVAILLFAGAAYAKTHKDDIEKDQTTYMGYTADQIASFAGGAGAVYAIFAVGFYIVNFAEIILYRRRTLDPTALLCFACFKTLASLSYLITNVVGAVEDSPSVLGFVLSTVLLLTSFVQLGLGAKYTRLKRRGALDGAAGMKQSGSVHDAPYFGAQPPPAVYAYGASQTTASLNAGDGGHYGGQHQGVETKPKPGY